MLRKYLQIIFRKLRKLRVKFSQCDLKKGFSTNIGITTFASYPFILIPTRESLEIRETDKCMW